MLLFIYLFRIFKSIGKMEVIKIIQRVRDHIFAHISARTSADLKDKWMNMSKDVLSH